MTYLFLSILGSGVLPKYAVKVGQFVLVENARQKSVMNDGCW